MQNEEIAVNAEHRHKIFYSVQGYWRQKRRPVVAVEDISFTIHEGELLTGLVYVCIGYLLFTWFEKLSLVDGKIEAI